MPNKRTPFTYNRRLFACLFRFPALFFQRLSTFNLFLDTYIWNREQLDNWQLRQKENTAMHV